MHIVCNSSLNLFKRFAPTQRRMYTNSEMLLIDRRRKNKFCWSYKKYHEICYILSQNIFHLIKYNQKQSYTRRNASLLDVKLEIGANLSK